MVVGLDGFIVVRGCRGLDRGAFLDEADHIVGGDGVGKSGHFDGTDGDDCAFSVWLFWGEAILRFVCLIGFVGSDVKSDLGKETLLQTR